MAITPRTILTSAAPATVAVVSLYFFTVLGTTAFTSFCDKGEVDQQPDSTAPGGEAVLDRTTSCDQVAVRFGDDPSTWSQFAWELFVYCFDQQDESRHVIDAADQGLEHHSGSEVLYNLKGQHQIMTGDYAGAVDTLQEGMDSVSHHRTGTMANNLAWASLWAPRTLEPEQARSLYVQALALSPDRCEIVHTGLFVEFAISNQTERLDRYESLTRFNDLRNRYNGCLDRLQDGDRKTVVEIIGAAVLFSSFDSISDDEVHPLMRSATSKFFSEYEETSIDAVCQEAMPLAEHHHYCVEAVETSLEGQHELERQHQIRDARVNEVRDEIVDQYGEDYPVLLNEVEP